MSSVSVLLLTMCLLTAAPVAEAEPDESAGGADSIGDHSGPDGESSTREPGDEPGPDADATASGDDAPDSTTSSSDDGEAGEEPASDSEPPAGDQPPSSGDGAADEPDGPDGVKADAGVSATGQSGAAGSGADGGPGEGEQQGDKKGDEGEGEEEAEDEDAEGEDDEGDKKNKKLSWSVGARVMTGWEGEVRRPEPDDTQTEPWGHEFFLRQARVKFRLDHGKNKRFGIRASIELADALKSPNFDRVSFLRNGYARLRFHDAARLHVGYFKRPFSRLELRSPGRLPFRGRGLANDRIVEDRNYGDRSVGGMLWGKIRPARMRYYVGTFAPALRTDGIDVVGRLRADPFEWGSIGASGGYKRVRNGIGDMVNVGSANVDLRFKFKGLYFLGDLVMGQDYLVPELPWALGLVGYVRYDIDLPKKLVLQPVVLAEWADINIRVSQNDAIRSVVGVNLLWRKRFRVMPQVEFIRPRGVIDNPWNNKDTYYVMLSLQL